MNTVPARETYTMRLLLLPLLALLVSIPPAHADDKEPTLDGKPFSAWMTLLKDSENGRVRRAAAAAVGQLASERPENSKMLKDTVVAVGKAMRNDSSAGVRGEATRALAKLASDLVKDKGDAVAFAVQDLAEGLRGEKDAEVRYEQASALQRFGDLARGAVSALGGAAADKDPKVQVAVATALGRIGKDARGATDDLLPLVKSADPDVRRAAVFALGRLDPTDKAKVSESIVKFTTDLDEQTRKEAISSLGLLADESVDTVKAVAVALTDTSVEVRRLAASTLARFGRGAFEANQELLAAFTKKDEDKVVKGYALHALCAGMKARGEDVTKVLPDILARLDPLVEKDAEVRLAICDEIGGIGPDAQSAIIKLRDAEKDPVKEVRNAATFAIKKIIAKKEEPKKDDKK